MTRASKDANDQERKSTDGESRFIRTSLCRHIPFLERLLQVKIARKVHGKRRSKNNFEGLYEVLAPGSHILKVSPTTSTIKELGKAIVTVRNFDNAKFRTQQEHQASLNVYIDAADRVTAKS